MLELHFITSRHSERNTFYISLIRNTRYVSFEGKKPAENIAQK